MAKIINFNDIKKEKEKETFERRLNDEIAKVEEKLGIEEEPLTVLTDNAAVTFINDLIDIKDSVTELLEILNVEECEELPWEEE